VGRDLRLRRRHGEASRLKRPDQATDALNEVATVAYDAAGNVVGAVNPLGNRTTLAYDALNRPVSTTTPLGFVTTVAYDAAGNPVATTNPRGYSTAVAFDVLNRPYQTTDALGNLFSAEQAPPLAGGGAGACLGRTMDSS
jgi:YD repeat-containing protein